MKYHPRKKKELVRSRTKPHDIRVRAVMKDPPDYDKLVRAIIMMAKEQEQSDKMKGNDKTARRRRTS